MTTTQTAPRRTGPRPKDPALRRTHLLCARVTHGDVEVINAYADRLGVTVSDLVRGLALNAAAQSTA